MRIAALGVVVWLAAAATAEGPIAFEIQLHPGLDAGSCRQLPVPDGVPGESDFHVAIGRGWVKLVTYSFDQSREFWPCEQRVRVEFPSAERYREFAGAMSACPQYPFYSGADYLLQRRIFERTAKAGDVETLRILLSKDVAGCASELNPPLYSILRRNPKAFLEAFAQLDPTQQQKAAEAQYDFNAGLAEQQFSRQTIASLAAPLRATATRFNELMAAKSQPPAPAPTGTGVAPQTP